MAWLERTEDPLDRWPKGPDGAPEEPALLDNLPDFEAYAGLAVTQLEAYGIPVLPKYSQRGQVGRLFGGFSTAGVELYVPKSRLEEARQLLRPAEDAGAEE